ncbi:MAG: hypothetical protein CMQ34_07285 [Gammaproteobacteria bacterium]|nr:hypothetical protein [Gammaproteobacteria bacterium]|tara:strand:- start:84 stop:1022 length:939 start_codon:yes stop_codon:yes gene_type:complete
MEYPMKRLLKLLWHQQQHLPDAVSRAIYKQMRKRGYAPAYDFTTDFFGLEYDGNLRNNIDFAIYFYGAFEKPLLFFMRDALHAIAGVEGVFVDVGANVGQHALFMSQRAHRVIAFEPYAPVRERLAHQIRLNAIRNITVEPVGLSDETAHQAFYAPTGDNAGIGSFDVSTTEKGNTLLGDLHVIRGDDYFAVNPPDYLHLIKLDVEGFEKPALQGLQQTLQRYRPLIVCELSYGNALSFKTRDEIMQCLPENYVLLQFNKRKSDGSKNRRKDGRTRISGAYDLIPYAGPLDKGQDDLIACPLEYRQTIPRVG